MGYVQRLVLPAGCYSNESPSPEMKVLSSLDPYPYPQKGVQIFMRSLRRLKNLEITWMDSSSHKIHCAACIDLLSIGWQTFGSNLCTLYLSIQLDSAPSLFETPLHFPQLRELDLNIFESKSSANSSEYSALMSFIHRHANALRALGIGLVHSPGYVKFFTLLGHFPNLHKLRFMGLLLDQNRKKCPDVFAKFLDLHSATLTDVDWYNHLGQNRGLFDNCFPKLTKLRFYFPGPDQDREDTFNNVVRFLHNHIQPLASLSLLGIELLVDKVHSLLSIKTLSQLRDLELSLLRLEYSTFSTVSTALPNLERFVVKFRDLDLSPADLLTGNLKDWSMLELVLEHDGARIDFIQKWGKLVLESFPRIEYFNGIYREDVLKYAVKLGAQRYQIERRMGLLYALRWFDTILSFLLALYLTVVVFVHIHIIMGV